MADVAAADVEQPGDGIEQRQQDRVGLLALQDLLHARRSSPSRCVRRVPDHAGSTGAEGGAGRSCQSRSIGFVSCGASVMPALPRLSRQALDLLDGVQIGVVADGAALRRAWRRAIWRPWPPASGALRTRKCRSGRAPAAGSGRQRTAPLRSPARWPRPAEPVKPVSQRKRSAGRRQELVLMLVAMGHEEALELAGLELPPERRHALGHRGRRTDLFEALKHGSPCKAAHRRNQSRSRFAPAATPKEQGGPSIEKDSRIRA